jgi:hypothetical protein
METLPELPKTLEAKNFYATGMHYLADFDDALDTYYYSNKENKMDILREDIKAIYKPYKNIRRKIRTLKIIQMNKEKPTNILNQIAQFESGKKGTIKKQLEQLEENAKTVANSLGIHTTKGGKRKTRQRKLKKRQTRRR